MFIFLEKEKIKKEKQIKLDLITFCIYPFIHWHEKHYTQISSLNDQYLSDKNRIHKSAH